MNVDSQKQEAGAKLLEEMLAKRGYLLSYHRMLAASEPGILSAYENLYTRLVLNERALNLAEREIVWIALIVVTRVRPRKRVEKLGKALAEINELYAGVFKRLAE